MDKAMDIENFRPIFEKVLKTNDLTAEKVDPKASIADVFDNGWFTCSNPGCFVYMERGRNHTWRSGFSWLTFDLRELKVKKKWKMKCQHCFSECKPYFTPEQVEAMFQRAVKRYKGEDDKPAINIGYGARRNSRQPHFPELCEKCEWGKTRCWSRR